ncbi:unnamed protein product, partial [Discosporangium mesarthrocarpum]
TLPVKRFGRVADLLHEPDFCGLASLSGAVVLGVDPPGPTIQLESPLSPGATALVTGACGAGRREGRGGVVSLSSRDLAARVAGARFGQFHIVLGDKVKGGSSEKGGAQLQARVPAGLVQEILGGIPVSLLCFGRSTRAFAEGAGAERGGRKSELAAMATEVARGLLEGLVVGGAGGGEAHGMVLRCSAAVDDNGWVMEGGNRYDVVHWLGPSWAAAAVV